MTLPINIEALINKNIIESERIEFKQGWNPQVILHSICAFANDFHNLGGGYLVVGVSEIEGVAVMPPVGIDVRQLDAIQKELLQVCHFISPHYFPIVEVAVIQGQSILVIWCPPGDTRPYKAAKSLSGKEQQTKYYYIRRLSSTVKASDADLQRLLELTAKVPFDNRINHHASIDDFNLTHIASFLQQVKSALYAELPQLSLAELTRNMGVARGSDEDIKPLNVGLLMFSDNPYQYFRGARIELIEYQDDIGDQFRETYFTGPVWQQLIDVMQYIKHQVIKEQVIKVQGQAEALRFYNFPFEAVEEAVANAVFHKGYDKENPIEINVRHDCIEVLSFPGPLPPVDQKMLQGEKIIARDCRNSRLGDFLKELNLTEGRGTGLPKIRRFMARNGSPKPVLETNSDNVYFLATLPIHEKFVVDLKESRLESRPELQLESELAKKVLTFLEELALSKSGLSARLGHKSVSGELNKQIKWLLEHGFIERTIPDKPTSRLQKYRLSTLGTKSINKDIK